MTEEARRNPARPWAGVAVIVLWGEAFLLTLRAKAPRAGLWGLPGGAINLGETALAAAAREVREETGIVCAPRRSFTTVDVIETDAGGTVFHFLLAAVVADYTRGAVAAGDDAADARWFTLDQLRDVPQFPHTAELVKAALALR